MNTRSLYIFTRTPLHVGAGSSVGAVDQPVQRERHTGFPIIPGSSIKGVLRDFFGGAKADPIFGNAAEGENSQGDAGIVSFSEARLLLFPLRSAKGAYGLATCPLALRRYARDGGLDFTLEDGPREMEAWAGKSVSLKNDDQSSVVLEEYAFTVTRDFPEDWARHLSGLLNDPVLEGAVDKFVLLSDTDFAYFAQNATQVNQHVTIDDSTGTAKKGGLFNEETIPSEALFYGVCNPFTRNQTDKQERLEETFEALSRETLLQFGGKNTTGLGFCTTKLI